jgi:NitT/TauT family transport system permease protein
MTTDVDPKAPVLAPMVDGTFEAVVAEPSPPRKRASGLVSYIGPLIVLIVFLAFWEYMHRDGMERLLDKRAFLVPSPVTVINNSFIANSIVRHDIIAGLGWTVYAALVGLLISIVVGMTIATLMSQAQWIERSSYPYLVALQAMPVLAIVPLINSVFGAGMGSRIFVCVMISIFPIVTNTLFGLTSVDPAQHDLFSLRQASRRTRLWRLQFPAAMPAIFTGFRISAGLCVIGAVVGEQFFREGDKPGLGVIMEEFRQKARFPQVYGGLMLAAALGIAVFFLFGFLGKLVVGKWYEPSRRSS